MGIVKEMMLDAMCNSDLAQLVSTSTCTKGDQKMVGVYAFKGRKYYGKPGIEFRPLQVQEDFGTWREAKSQDGKVVASWLVKNGYRKVWYKAVKSEAAGDYEEYWCHESLVGYDCEHLSIPPTVLKKLVGKPEEKLERKEVIVVPVGSAEAEALTILSEIYSYDRK